MSWLAYLPTAKVLLFTLVLTRMSGLVMTAPVYGGTSVPMQIRALLAFALALLILPTQWHVTVADPGTLLAGLLLVGGELLVGVWLGTGIQVLLSGIQLTGQLIGRISGESMSDLFDPSLQENVPLLSQLVFQVALAVFLCLGGHRLLMQGLLDTFHAMPPGHIGMPDAIGQTCEVLLTQSFQLGVRAAAPAVTALMLATVLMGIVGRALPQLNVMSLGYNLNALLMFAVVALTLGGAVWVFQDHIDGTIEALVGTVVRR